MLALFVFTLLLGGGFLAVSVLGGALGGADLDLDTDLDLDVGGHLDGALHGAGDAEAARLFSLRSLVYALFGFGATGTVLTLAAPSGNPATHLALAVAGGLLTGGLATAIFRWMAATESGAHAGDDAWVGLTGRVTLPLSGPAPGAIVVERGARRHTLRALPHAARRDEGGEPGAWTDVVVVEMEGGVARVVPVDPDLTLEP